MSSLPLQALKAARLMLALAKDAENEALERATGGQYCGGCETCAALEPAGLRDIENAIHTLDRSIVKLEAK